MHHGEIAKMLTSAGADVHLTAPTHNHGKVLHRRKSRETTALEIATHYDHHEVVGHLRAHIEAQENAEEDGFFDHIEL